MSNHGQAIAMGEGTESTFPPSTRYRALTAIASSDIATVYVGSLCGPGGFERRVAIKRTHPRLVNETTTRLMVDEARLASRIQHPNVVGVRDVEELDGELLLIMDYVEGVSLSRLLDGGAIPARVAGRILVDAATGLAAVHALADSGEMSGDVVHRNVSPSNILVGTDGTSRLSDFGIARSALASVAGDVAVGIGRGGPAYLAPEYLDTGVATPLLDVFALGVVAWETFTSRRLFRALTDTETTERIRGGVIPPPSDVVSGLDPELDAVILSALARDPRQRCSARELAVGLEQALHRAGLLSSRREVEEIVLHRCAESIQDRRRRIRSATHTGEGALSVPPPLPPSGRFPHRASYPPGAPQHRTRPRRLAQNVGSRARGHRSAVGPLVEVEESVGRGDRRRCDRPLRLERLAQGLDRASAPSRLHREPRDVEHDGGRAGQGAVGAGARCDGHGAGDARRIESQARGIRACSVASGGCTRPGRHGSRL